MGVYIAQADIQAAMSSDDYSRLFDRNGSGNGSEITAFVTLCIGYGESRINGVLKAYFPVPLPSPVDSFVKQVNIDLACAFADRYHPAYQGRAKSAYGMAAQEGLDDLAAMVKGTLRPVTSNVGESQPVAAQVNATNVDGDSNSPFTQAANGESQTDF